MSIGKHGDGYRAQVWNPVKKKREYSKTCRTRSEAKKEEARIIRRIESGGDPSSSLPVQVAYEMWFDVSSGNVSEKTRDAYVYNWKRYCSPLSGLIVQKTRPIDIVSWRTDLEAKYSSETVNKAFSLASSVFNFCRDVLGIIEVSPLEHVPRCKVRRVQRSTWTSEEIKAFLKSIEDSAYYVPIALICTTGMRPGECCGLMDDDLSPAGSLTLRRGRNNHGSLTEMKTERSHRTIVLSASMAEAIRAYIKEKHAAGCLRRDLFVTADLSPVRPDVLSSHFRSLVDRYNRTHTVQLPVIRLYDVRHSFATNLLIDGVKSKLISEVMGNSVHTMEHHYVHLKETMHKDILETYASKII